MSAGPANSNKTITTELKAFLWMFFILVTLQNTFATIHVLFYRFCRSAQ